MTPAPQTEDLIAQLEALIDKVTREPWETNGAAFGRGLVFHCPPPDAGGVMEFTFNRRYFLACHPANLRTLLDSYRTAERERDEARKPEPPQGVLEALKERVLSRLIYPVSTQINPRGWALHGREMIEEAVRFLQEDVVAERSPLPLGGWKLVPEKPTPEMVEAGNGTTGAALCPAVDVYRAMLAASPSPSSGDA